MAKVRAIVLANEREGDHHLWLRACEAFKEQIECRIVHLTRNEWLEAIQEREFDVLLAKPGGFTSPFKQLYDERIMILHRVLGYPVFPTLDEILLYENKRYLSFWLKANRLPHPETRVFYFKQEAMAFLIAAGFPIVAKVNIGASGSGVTVLNDEKEATAYIERAFSRKGAQKRCGPNLRKGGWLRRGGHYLFHPGDIARKISLYRARRADVQDSFVLFQEYIPHEFEWRAVRIGDSFFAHKKMKSGGMASGSLLKNYDNPPLDLFDFVKDFTDRFGFRSLAVDMFEKSPGRYLINELQCFFGQSDPIQMQVDGQPGRYRHYGKQWVFEAGEFNASQSYNLRVQHVIERYSKSPSAGAE